MHDLDRSPRSVTCFSFYRLSTSLHFRRLVREIVVEVDEKKRTNKDCDVAMLTRRLHVL